MQLILLSDVHATTKQPIGRTDDITQTFFKKFGFILRYARKHKARILQAGDFFHRPRDWHLLFKIMALLTQYKVKVYSIFGQHDTYLYADVTQSPTTLGILQRAGLLEILTRQPTTLDFGEVSIYGVSWGQPVPIPKGKHNILVIHAPISDIEVYPGHAYVSPRPFLKKYEAYDLVLAGDTHRHFYAQFGDSQLVNTGPLLRLEANAYNYLHEPSFYVYDTDTKTLTRVKVPHDNPEKVLTRKHIENAESTNILMQEFIESLKGGLNENYQGMNLKESLNQYVKDNKIEKEVVDIIAGVMDNEPK